jgi:hypothetical protein
MAENRDIKYINKDFSELRQALINFTKTYFPTTYTDFSPASPGMAFMEMAAYVGDILSFYQDNQIQETFLQFARQTNNLYELAYMFGYKPNVTGVATADIDVYQQVPSVTSGSVQVPDFSYALYFAPNTSVRTTTVNPVNFLIQDSIDFSVSSSTDPTEVTVYSVSGNQPNRFLLKKTRKAISATINTTTFTFGDPTPFATVNINADNIVGILDIVDSDGNIWYEVDYLAQETVYQPIKNTNTNDPNSYVNNGDAPYILKLEKIQRRFATRFINSGSLQIQFGSGIAYDNDEEITPNPFNVGIGLPSEQSKLTTAYSPSNFIFTKTYGIAPSSTTLTVRYLTGGGVESNVPANTINGIVNQPVFLTPNLNTTTANSIIGSIAVNNAAAADGGQDGDSIEEIRQNAIGNFGSQLRNVTQDDYLVRALSLPSQYGVIAKAYIEPVKAQNVLSGEIPSTLDLYILSYDANNNLRTCSNTLKQNLSTYLSQYRVIGDSVRIKDGFIINIGVNFEIVVLPDYNNNDVLLNCINTLKEYFAINKWSINQPIILRDLYVLLDQIDGVQTVKNISIVNKVGTNIGYSQYAYDIEGATQNNVIYPSLDPSIFEVKYPNTDIQGKVVSL